MPAGLELGFDGFPGRSHWGTAPRHLRSRKAGLSRLGRCLGWLHRRSLFAKVVAEWIGDWLLFVAVVRQVVRGCWTALQWRVGLFCWLSLMRRLLLKGGLLSSFGFWVLLMMVGL